LETLNAAVAELSEQARNLIRLRNVERRSFAEVGSMLGCSADAARKRWVRAVADLRAILTAHERSTSHFEPATP
jgi:RNA polymerase sigma factor (sigma-70 family)